MIRISCERVIRNRAELALLQSEDRKGYKFFKQSLWKLIPKDLSDLIQKYSVEKTGENKRR